MPFVQIGRVWKSGGRLFDQQGFTWDNTFGRGLPSTTTTTSKVRVADCVILSPTAADAFDVHFPMWKRIVRWLSPIGSSDAQVSAQKASPLRWRDRHNGGNHAGHHLVFIYDFDRSADVRNDSRWLIWAPYKANDSKKVVGLALTSDQPR